MTFNDALRNGSKEVVLKYKYNLNDQGDPSKRVDLITNDVNFAGFVEPQLGKRAYVNHPRAYQTGIIRQEGQS